VRHGHADLPDDALAEALAQTPPDAPVTILIHGYRYSPFALATDPHRLILADSRAATTDITWPRHLHLDRSGSGLGIAFGWEARGTLWHAWRRSGHAARALADLTARLRNIAPNRRIGVLAHSLGARVALMALAHTAPGDIARVVMLAGAAFRGEAEAVLATDAGRATEFVSVISRENDLFDFCTEWLVSGGRGHALGHGLAYPVPNWVDLQIDHPGVLSALARISYTIAPPSYRVCHWSAYQRPGIFALYRSLLTNPIGLPLPLLADALPDALAPRWSRLLARPLPAMPLPFPRDPSSWSGRGGQA
jgi:hypothetical protein